MTLSERLQTIIESFVDSIGKAITTSKLDDVIDMCNEAAIEKPYRKLFDPQEVGGYAFWAGLTATAYIKPTAVKVGRYFVTKYEAIDAATGNVITTRSRKARAKLEAKKKGYTFA